MSAPRADRCWLRRLVILFGILAVAILLAPAGHAGDGHGGWVSIRSENVVPKREVGYGQIRYAGHGPEYWHWRFTQERERSIARWQPQVSYALRLAAAAYGVSIVQLRSVSYCESRHYVFARNGRYRGIFQEGTMFENGPYGRAGFSVFDPIANALTAARVVSGEGWGQWECKP